MEIPFTKYTTYGNNFIIVNETEKDIIPEPDLAACAVQITSRCFGVGADSLIVIQKYNKNVLQNINKDKKYWKTIPDSLSAGYIFRMFEPNGNEALNCGNGLLALADYFFSNKNMAEVKIVTEIPSSSPCVRTIGTDINENRHWVNIGKHKRVRERLTIQKIRKPVTDCIDRIDNIRIDFCHDNFQFLTLSAITLTGYLISTGEPHLVIFTDTMFSDPSKGDLLFKKKEPDSNIDIGLWFVNYIGSYLNKKYANFFPKGINVNFIKIVDAQKGLIKHRCFERGINKETMACGTGAVAVAALALNLNMISCSKITLLPHRCCLRNPDAKILIKKENGNYFLYGYPSFLCKGEFIFKTYMNN